MNLQQARRYDRFWRGTIAVRKVRTSGTFLVFFALTCIGMLFLPHIKTVLSGDAPHALARNHQATTTIPIKHIAFMVKENHSS